MDCLDQSLKFVRICLPEHIHSIIPFNQLGNYSHIQKNILHSCMTWEHETNYYLFWNIVDGHCPDVHPPTLMLQTHGSGGPSAFSCATHVGGCSCR